MATLRGAAILSQFARMSARTYIDALLRDADMADEVWELWNVKLIVDDLAAMAWSLISTFYARQPYRKG